MHRPSRETAAWVCALSVAAGLSLGSSLPRNGAQWADLPPRTIGAAAQTISSALDGLARDSRRSASLLRPDCTVLRVPDPREVSLVMRAAYAAHPGAVITVGWLGEYPRAARVVSVCG